MSATTFSHCFSETEGGAINFKSLNIMINKICGYNCSSSWNQQPGGAFFRIDHIESAQALTTNLSMVTALKTPNNNNSYATITLFNGVISYDHLNATENSALTNPVCCIWSPTMGTTSSGSYINGVSCFSFNENVFCAFGSHQISKMNLVNSTSSSIENALFRSFSSNVIVHDSIFIGNKGNSFIAVESTASITFTNCYFPTDAIKMGNGQIKGDPIMNSKTIDIIFSRCFYTIICSKQIFVRNNSILCPLRDASIFLLCAP